MHFITGKSMERRTFLKGMGASIGLPVLSESTALLALAWCFPGALLMLSWRFPGAFLALRMVLSSGGRL